MPDTSHHNSASAREAILRAALDLITVHGTDNVTHRLVADTAGVSPGTTTYHFETREDLIRAAFALYIEEYLAGFDAALVSRPVNSRQDLASFLTMTTNLSPENADLALLEYEMVTHAQRDAALQAEVRDWARQMEFRLAKMLAKVGDDAPVKTANLLMSVCRGTEYDVLSRGISVSRERFEARILSLVALGA